MFTVQLLNLLGCKMLLSVISLNFLRHFRCILVFGFRILRYQNDIAGSLMLLRINWLFVRQFPLDNFHRLLLLNTFAPVILFVVTVRKAVSFTVELTHHNFVPIFVFVLIFVERYVMIDVWFAALVFSCFIYNSNYIFILEVRRSPAFIFNALLIIDLHSKLTDFIFPLMAIAFGLFIGTQASIQSQLMFFSADTCGKQLFGSESVIENIVVCLK